MNGGKKRSGFQITSVTSDCNQTPAGQSGASSVLTLLQSAAFSSCGAQGSSSQPTTPLLKRKFIPHDASVQGPGSSSRFRVVRLAVGGLGGGGRGEPYCRGRWTCTDFMTRQQGMGFRRVMDTMRHAHSLESLEMTDRDMDRVCPQIVSFSAQLPSYWIVPSHSDPYSYSSSLQPGPTHLQPYRRCQRRPPKTPPLPLRTLQLVAKQPETPVVLRDPRMVRGHVSSVRESWPGAGPTTLESKTKMSQRSLTPPSWGQPITEAQPRTTNQPQPHVSLSAPPSVMLPAASHPHWSKGQGSEATMMSLLLFCHSSSNNSFIAIDDKIEQAMDLVKSHLKLAVREEVELLKEQIRELQEKNQQLEIENHILRTHNRHNT